MLYFLLISLLTFVQYNCENLFDCIDDSVKEDNEFLPTGSHRWTKTKYWHKLDKVGKTLIACGKNKGKWAIPDLIALCEVESDTVLHDLTRRSLLRGAGYRYLMTHSPDRRGINVALLYSPFSFSPINHYGLRIDPLPNMKPTRDILYVSGRVISGDTLHVFVVHAPSRSMGASITMSHRLAVTRKLSQAVDSIRGLSEHAQIMIAGDFNDYSASPALRLLTQNGLYEVSANAKGLFHQTSGTYKYKGEWDSLDHIFISESLRRKSLSCHIFDADFLLTEDPSGGKKPRRTYLGSLYINGFSDHLPLVWRMDCDK